MTLCAVLLAAACTAPTSATAPSPSIREYPTGGTLRVAVAEGFGEFPSLDPQKSYDRRGWEILRCCLLRTLLSFRGVPTREGGTVLQPDLATGLPDLSADGLTWTFHLRRGIRYGPPLQRLQVTAQDFVRALRREADPAASEGGYASYYSVIQGFDDVVAGRAQTISGLEAPDPFTLRVHLVHPEGDLGHLFAMPATAPIPPTPGDPDSGLGIARGHDRDLSGFLVGTGPYMLEGSEAMDPSLPPGRQAPAAGYVAGEAIRLVRNPSWQPETDRIRPAYVDRIEITAGGTLEEASARLDRGTQDLVFQLGPAPQAPPEQIAAYRDDPARGSVDIEPRDAIRYVSMNLAVPPLDDVNVRIAVNLAVDKQAVLAALGGELAGRITNHISPDSLEENLLLNYDPFPTPDSRGDLVAARRSMARSRYDRDHDGRCDVGACRAMLSLTVPTPQGIAASKVVAANLRAIGLNLTVEPGADLFDRLTDPSQGIPLAIDIAWLKDIPSASNYFVPLFGSPAAGPLQGNYSLVGATSAQLDSWGLGGPGIPPVDDRIQQCLATTGAQWIQCWSTLDQYLTGRVVPWVPLISESQIQVVPTRVLHYSYDQFANLPALDQIALRR